MNEENNIVNLDRHCSRLRETWPNFELEEGLRVRINELKRRKLQASYNVQQRKLVNDFADSLHVLQTGREKGIAGAVKRGATVIGLRNNPNVTFGLEMQEKLSEFKVLLTRQKDEAERLVSHESKKNGVQSSDKTLKRFFYQMVATQLAEVAKPARANLERVIHLNSRRTLDQIFGFEEDKPFDFGLFTFRMLAMLEVYNQFSKKEEESQEEAIDLLAMEESIGAFLDALTHAQETQKGFNLHMIGSMNFAALTSFYDACQVSESAIQKFTASQGAASNDQSKKKIPLQYLLLLQVQQFILADLSEYAQLKAEGQRIPPELIANLNDRLAFYLPKFRDSQLAYAQAKGTLHQTFSGPFLNACDALRERKMLEMQALFFSPASSETKQPKSGMEVAVRPSVSGMDRLNRDGKAQLLKCLQELDENLITRMFKEEEHSALVAYNNAQLALVDAVIGEWRNRVEPKIQADLEIFINTNYKRSVDINIKALLKRHKAVSIADLRVTSKTMEEAGQVIEKAAIDALMKKRLALEAAANIPTEQQVKGFTDESFDKLIGSEVREKHQEAIESAEKHYLEAKNNRENALQLAIQASSNPDLPFEDVLKNCHPWILRTIELPQRDNLKKQIKDQFAAIQEDLQIVANSSSSENEKKQAKNRLQALDSEWLALKEELQVLRLELDLMLKEFQPLRQDEENLSQEQRARFLKLKEDIQTNADKYKHVQAAFVKRESIWATFFENATDMINKMDAFKDSSRFFSFIGNLIDLFKSKESNQDRKVGEIANIHPVLSYIVRLNEPVHPFLRARQLVDERAALDSLRTNLNNLGVDSIKTRLLSFLGRASESLNTQYHSLRSKINELTNSADPAKTISEIIKYFSAIESRLSEAPELAKEFTELMDLIKYRDKKFILLLKELPVEVLANIREATPDVADMMRDLILEMPETFIHVLEKLRDLPEVYFAGVMKATKVSEGARSEREDEFREALFSEITPGNLQLLGDVTNSAWKDTNKAAASRTAAIHIPGQARRLEDENGDNVAQDLATTYKEQAQFARRATTTRNVVTNTQPVVKDIRELFSPSSLPTEIIVGRSPPPTSSRH